MLIHRNFAGAMRSQKRRRAPQRDRGFSPRPSGSTKGVGSFLGGGIGSSRVGDVSRPLSQTQPKYLLRAPDRLWAAAIKGTANVVSGVLRNAFVNRAWNYSRAVPARSTVGSGIFWSRVHPSIRPTRCTLKGQAGFLGCPGFGVAGGKMAKQCVCFGRSDRFE